jgi:hypothetical protein
MTVTYPMAIPGNRRAARLVRGRPDVPAADAEGLDDEEDEFVQIIRDAANLIPHGHRLE